MSHAFVFFKLSPGTQLAYTLTSEEELMGLRDELPTRKKIFKDDNPYSLKIPDKK